MGIYNYEEGRNFQRPLDIEKFNRIVAGATIMVSQGNFPELKIKDYNGEVRWIANKSRDGESWCIYYGKAKLPYEYIRFNENKVEDLSVVAHLIDCTDEVLNMYKYD